MTDEADGARGVVIEDYSGDERDGETVERPRSVPIVEEPDDDGAQPGAPSSDGTDDEDDFDAVFEPRKRPRNGRCGGLLSSLLGGFDFDFGFGDDDDLLGGGVSQSFSSSTVMTTGPDGKPRVRSRTSTARRVGSRVAEVRDTKRDSATGVERVRLTRKIGAKTRTVEKCRVNGGAVTTRESLRGIPDTPAERDAFDREFSSALGAQHTPQIQDAPRRSKNTKKPRVVCHDEKI